MKLNIPLSKRLRQLFCKHEVVGWVSQIEGINTKLGQELVSYECGRCGLSISEWFEKGAWTELEFPDEYTVQNKRKLSKKKGRGKDAKS